MPNYVYNTIICKENLLSKILDEDKNVRFGILVPPPTTREQCIADYGEEYLDEIDENGHSTNYLDHRYDPEWFNWYKWNCHFWGTKWDAAESEVREENGYYYVSFTTAWSPPTEWIQQLVKVGLPFILHWEEEQGYGQMVTFNSELEYMKTWDVPEKWDEETYEPIRKDPTENSLPTLNELIAFFGD